MKLRALGAVAAAVLLMTVLAGCRTNVGTAAVIDGHRVTESDVSSYITPAAQPVTVQTSSSGATIKESPRSFVVRELIYDRLFRALLAHTGSGVPTDGQLSAQLRRDLNGQSEDQAARRLGVKGYAAKFDALLLRVQVLQQLLGAQIQHGLDIAALVKKVHLPVTVKPRYGKWNPQKLSFDGSTAIPPYLTVQSGGAAQ